MNLRLVTLWIAISFPISSLDAQHPLILSKLTEWNAGTPVPGNDILKTEIQKKAADIYASRASCRNSDVSINIVEPATADRYAFNAIIRKTLKNAWFVTTRLPECDPAPVRYMIMQNSDNTLQTIRVNRGESYAWDSLIGDTLPAAQLAATIALKRNGVECNSNEKPTLGVARIDSKEANLGKNTFGIRYSGSWTEIWPIEFCKRTVEVAIKFTADGDGGAFTHIPGDKTRVLP
ncbi:MAG TPA: hypothetical protein VF463_02650 [Sphingobium sp.]